MSTITREVAEAPQIEVLATIFPAACVGSLSGCLAHLHEKARGKAGLK